MSLFQDAVWVNEPQKHTVTSNKVSITTEPGSDFWQRTYYGFRNDNAHALLISSSEPYFSFVTRVDFTYAKQFDQCGVIVYQDSDNWLKASIEYENNQYGRLGSVTTNLGYSDWATTDIPADVSHMHYRLSRRESDFCLECSGDGQHFQQMRICHLHEGAGNVRFGIYACSPSSSSFEAVFTQFSLGPCQWRAHS